MAENSLEQKTPEQKTKSAHAEREEKILAFWKEKGIFGKSLNKEAPEGEFVFYEGPPTANGRPGIHHLEARAFKDAIPRYKTMRGFHVRRKGGWDTHGLPVELQVEKELGLKSKKEIETYGIAAFNEKCKESVWKYVHEWEEFTDRMGYWVDLKNPYITYKPEYIESLWNIVKHVDDRKLLYKDYKVVPWCPRCETGLSSHELAQGYEEVKDLAVTVKFKIKNQKSKVKSEAQTYLLAWTTTPWTLPGNVALAINKDIEYVKVRLSNASAAPRSREGSPDFDEAKRSQTKGETPSGDQGAGLLLILAKSRLSILEDTKYEIVETLKGSELVGLEYEPIYSFIPKNSASHKVYAADFVTTEEGAGIVHIAPMYGQDDFELGTKVGLPKYHLVNEDGTFKKGTGFLAGKFVKDEATNVEIIKDLASRGLLFGKEKHEHSYPHCWRCHTPLIYFARDSWYIKMSELRNKLVKENEGIHWEPDYIKEGRFGEWLREVKDWAISRERYWGTPLPVWVCDKCHDRRVVGSVEELKRKPKNTYYVMWHGEAEGNAKKLLNGGDRNRYHLTEAGKLQVLKAANEFRRENIELIYVSPFLRAKETAELVRKIFGFQESQVIIEERLREAGFGEYNEKPTEDFFRDFPWDERFEIAPAGGEKYGDIKSRVGDLLYELEQKHQNKRMLLISHGSPSMMMLAAAAGLNRKESIELEKTAYIDKAELRKIDFSILPHNVEYELDLHRPFIDQVKLDCKCGGEMSRVKEVMDVWFDSGAMPFAQDHEFKLKTQNSKLKSLIANIFHREEKFAYPADYISEAIDQTRGWFYTLHAIGCLMGKGKAYKNVICLGHILDAKGKKMSKSLGNIVNPWEIINKYGADALRFWMYSVNSPGDAKNFEEKTVDEIVKKVFNLVLNVTAFYRLYAVTDKNVIQLTPAAPANSSNRGQVYKVAEHGDLLDFVPGEKEFAGAGSLKTKNILDQWILARLNQLIATTTENLDKYILLEPTRAIRDFVADLSQWYIRRSRDRFKGDDQDDKNAALATTRFVLLELSKVMAPFTPFFAEHIYGEVNGGLGSVHLENWPEAGEVDEKLLKDMETVRYFASKGLEARTASKINVRQPLNIFRIYKYEEYMLGKDTTGQKKMYPSGQKIVLSDELIDLIRDEINVKKVIFDFSTEKEVDLDTTITPELKEEGMVRELIRVIQDLRKEKGLTVNDRAILIVKTDDGGRKFIDKNKEAISKATLLKGVEFGNVEGVEAVKVGELAVKVGVRMG